MVPNIGKTGKITANKCLHCLQNGSHKYKQNMENFEECCIVLVDLHNPHLMKTCAYIYFTNNLFLFYIST